MKIVSLFAGCGGLDLGFHRAGHEIVHASDFDKDSVDTYNSYFKNKAELMDVHDLKGKDLPDYDLLVGGFPCQGFSVANIYRSKDDSRNQLYTQIVRLLKESKPKLVILTEFAVRSSTTKSLNSFKKILYIVSSPVVNVNWLFAESQVKLSTPATGAVLAEVILPSASTVITGICVEEP